MNEKLITLSNLEEFKQLTGLDNIPLFYAGKEETQDADLAVLTKAYQEFKKTGNLIPVYHVYSDEPTDGVNFMNNKGPRVYWLSLINYNTTGGFSNSVSNATFIFSCLRIPNTEYDIDSTWVTRLRWSGFSVECSIRDNAVKGFVSTYKNSTKRRDENIAFESTVTKVSNDLASLKTTVDSLPTKDYVDAESVTFKPLPDDVDWEDISTDEFIAKIQELNLPSGMAYLQHVRLTDLPAGLAGGEVEVYIYPWNVIYCRLRSADRAPYLWELNSFDNRGWESIGCQVYELPAAIESNAGKIIQYIGTDEDVDLVRGYYYQLVGTTSTETADDGTETEVTTYTWENINVQPSSEVDTSNFYTKEEVDALIGDINAVLATLTTVVADEEEY